jgi:trigger factor
MSEVLRGKALAFVLEHAKISDASGRPVDLDSLTREFDESPAAPVEATDGEQEIEPPSEQEYDVAEDDATEA